MIHIAGTEVTVGWHLRQRCAWCGATLIDVDLERVCVPEGQDAGYATWPAGVLVETGSCYQRVVTHDAENDKLPDGCCALLDPTVTT